MVPGSGLVSPKAEEGGDKDPIGVLEVVLLAAKVDFCHLECPCH